MATNDEIEGLRKALEAETRRCQELQSQLDRARAGFEAFVSSAAHDLREPLRDVAAFSQLLEEAGAGRLDSDPDAAQFLMRIREGATRMQSLLTDVLDYWSIGTCGPPASPVGMEAALNQALLGADIQGAIVTRGPLPRVYGDFEILTKVLQHLIRNAIEYSGRPDPHIHVSSDRRNQELTISVHDDGPGIELAFHDRIFRAFQRLHGREFPGNGLGLAFCRKAIEWQGGRIWVESTPGAGTTFCFTLPAPEE